ncbi:MAG: hypothetical protein ACRDI2_19965 [Chloroflexota bacterium]
MTVEEQLREEVRRYLHQEHTLRQLHRWLAGHVRQLADSPDEAARRLDGLAWLLISEYSYGHRTEDSVRARLTAAAPELASHLDRVTVLAGDRS